jgi:Amt family ammonium transporter
VRSKNMLSVLMQVFVTFSMIVVLWVAVRLQPRVHRGQRVRRRADRLFLKACFDPVKGEFAMAATFSKGVYIPRSCSSCSRRPSRPSPAA